MALDCADTDGDQDMGWISTGDEDRTSSYKRYRNTKHEVFSEILERLTVEGYQEVQKAGFADELQAHFARLPTRYALDVKKDKADKVLIHKRLLEQAEIPENLPVFHVRTIFPAYSPSSTASNSSSNDSSPLNTNMPAFGSALSDMYSRGKRQLNMNIGNNTTKDGDTTPMHEVTFSTIDKPKLLSQLSTILADVNLHVWEAHVFSTIDGYSLDVFEVYGWVTENMEELAHALRNSINLMEEGAWLKTSPTVSPYSSPSCSPDSVASAKPLRDALVDAPDDWEIDHSQLKLVKKLSSSTGGESYKGTFCGQDVTIKIIKPETSNEQLQEFVHEISVMRKVRHKNIVQFIGACTRPPNLCIVTEYMPGGTVHDFLHKQKSALPFPDLVRIALDVAKGMDYLHQNKIIHRDLKASCLLMDENGVAKVGDFGVARIQAQGGMMTGETGTYRWMAPEVIGHQSYDQKADVFSFGVLVWELLTKKLPYDYLTPFQAAVGVLQEGLRPSIPQDTHPRLTGLMEKCWKTNATERPDFSEVTMVLKELISEVEENNPRLRIIQTPPIGFFSSLKRTSTR